MHPPRPSLSRHLLAGGAWAIGGRGVVALSEIATNALLARLLTPLDLGAYFLALSAVSLGAMTGTLGLHQVAVRFVAAALGLDQPARARRLLAAVLCVGAIGALVAGLLYFLVGARASMAVFHAPALAAVTAPVAVWIAVLAWQRLLAESFRGFHDIARASLYGGALSGALLAVILGALWWMDVKITLATVLGWVIGTAAVSVVLAAYRLRRRVATLPLAGRMRATEYRDILRAAWPLLLINLTLFALTQMDIWILAMFRPQAEVATYAAAARLALTTMLLTSILYAVLPPLIAEKHARNEKHLLERLLRAGATASALLALPVFAAFVLFPADILALVYGAYYRDAGAVLALLAVGLYVNVATGMRGYVLMMTGNERVELAISLFGGVLNVALCLLGAIYFGVIGVAAAAMAAMIVQCAAEELAVKRRLGVWTHVSTAAWADIRGLWSAARAPGR